jgi:hypothetical protein
MTSISDVENLKRALGWLYNYPAASLPPASSLAFEFTNTAGAENEEDWSKAAYQTLQSSLAFVLTFFTENSWGNSQLGAFSGNRSEGYTFLPKEYHTTASICTPTTRFVVDKRMFAIFVVLQSLPIIFAWMVLVLMLYIKLPCTKISSFHLIDFMYKARLTGSIPDEQKMRDLDDSMIISLFKDVMVYKAIPPETAETGDLGNLAHK